MHGDDARGTALTSPRPDRLHARQLGRSALSQQEMTLTLIPGRLVAHHLR